MNATEKQAANVGAVTLDLVSIAGGVITCDHAQDGYVRVGFGHNQAHGSHHVETTVEVGRRYGGERKVHVSTHWGSDGGCSITDMQLALAQAAKLVDLLRNWGFELEVVVA